MVVPFLQRSRFLRALVLTTGVFSFLLWLYIVLRIVVNNIDPPEPFLPGMRSPSFLTVGAFAFGLSFLSLLAYLWLWGKFDRASGIPRSTEEHQP